VIIGDEDSYWLWSSGYLGDLDRDGFDDLLIGDPAAFGGAGAAYLFLGPVSGVHAVGDADLIVIGDGGAFGGTLRGVHDVTGDGIIDIAVGAVTTDNGFGQVWFFSGADLLALLP
jgi:hypothetical protein